MKTQTLSIIRAEAGRKGGVSTFSKYGVEHMKLLGHKGGRPPIPKGWYVNGQTN